MCHPIRRNARRGFTLVEILAVVVIIGIASAIIIPQMGTRDDMRAAAAARVLMADLIYAQNMAISNGSTVYVKFDIANKKYTLLTKDASNNDVAMSHPITQTTYEQRFGDTNPNTVESFETVTIESASFNGISVGYTNMYTLAFDEIGSPYAFSYTTNAKDDLNTGSVVIKCGTFTKTITVTAATGEITAN